MPRRARPTDVALAPPVAAGQPLTAGTGTLTLALTAGGRTDEAAVATVTTHVSVVPSSMDWTRY
jgi:hypothetical protein